MGGYMKANPHGTTAYDVGGVRQVWEEESVCRLASMWAYMAVTHGRFGGSLLCVVHPTEMRNAPQVGGGDERAKGGRLLLGA
jgi:hypothetical protein